MNETNDAAAILAPIWRRKWLILLVGLLVAAGTYLYYKRQSAHFQATTEVYLGAGAEEQLSEKSGGGGGKNGVQGPANQTQIINSIVIESTKRQLRHSTVHINKVAAKGKAKAKSGEKSQFITITAESHSPRAAALLANSIAAAYIKRSTTNHRRDVLAALSITRRQLLRLEAAHSAPAPTNSKNGKQSASKAAGGSSVIQSAQLATKINQLESQLGIISVRQVKVARPHGSKLLGSSPKKNAEFGFVIGLVIASIAAFLLSRLNRRLRTLADVEAVLHHEVLTSLPKVRSPIVKREGWTAPSRFLVEPLRRLHTTLLLEPMAAEGRRSSPRSVLFISAEPGDGKSTVAADLALVQAESGEQVMLLEADFRRPVQARMLGLAPDRGLSDVLTGRLALADALQVVHSTPAQVMSAPPSGNGAVATAVEPRGPGAAWALTSGPPVPNPPALLASGAMAELVRSAAEDYDRVLIDAPGPLAVSDVMPLLGIVDAIVLVARLGHTREQAAAQLHQLLARTPTAPVLGVVANGVPRAEISKYGAGALPQKRWPGSLVGR
jgi:Mrp family chromosome partitioning ATPase/capsular polysaccharide biosynthesis protein